MEVCISLFVMSFLFLLFYTCLKTLSENSTTYIELQDKINAIQLQEWLMASKNIEVDEHLIQFHKFDSLYSIEIDYDRVVITPGYMIYYTDLIDPYFSLESNEIILHYKRKEKDMQLVIGYEQ